MIDDVRDERLPNGRPYKRIVLNVQKRKVPILAAAVGLFEKKCREHVSAKSSSAMVDLGPEEDDNENTETNTNHIDGNGTQMQQQAPMQSSQIPLALSVSGAGFQSDPSQRGVVGATATTNRGNVSTTIVPPTNQRGELGATTGTGTAKLVPKPSVLKKTGENCTKITNAGPTKSQEWFTVVDPIANKDLYISSATHQVLEAPPSKQTAREKLPPGWISVVDPDSGKEVFVNIKKRRVEESINEVMKTATNEPQQKPQVQQTTQSTVQKQKEPILKKQAQQKEQRPKEPHYSGSSVAQLTKAFCSQAESSPKPVKQKQAMPRPLPRPLPKHQTSLPKSCQHEEKPKGEIQHQLPQDEHTFKEAKQSQSVLHQEETESFHHNAAQDFDGNTPEKKFPDFLNKSQFALAGAKTSQGIKRRPLPFKKTN